METGGLNSWPFALASPRLLRGLDVQSILCAMDVKYGVALTTFPDPETGRRFAEGLLEKRLAACVQTLPIQSAYRWKGAIQNEAETMMLIKTKASLYPEVEAFLRATHPYEVPEIVWIPIEAGLADYLGWIGGETK